jgi:hypothetical protein
LGPALVTVAQGCEELEHQYLVDEGEILIATFSLTPAESKCGYVRQHRRYSAVANWRKRFTDFPAPLAELKSGPVFSDLCADLTRPE